MIYAFTGKTGSGKTFRMVAEAYRYWRQGIDIYSNTVLFFGDESYNWVENLFYFVKSNTCKVLKIDCRAKKRGRITYFEDISEILEAKDGIILFDEAQVLFSARQWERLSDDFIYKLQQHRKHKLDLFCTTQNMGTIDIMYRRLVQRWFHHENVFQIGKNHCWLGLFRIKEKDIDFLYNSVDDLQVPDIKTKYFFIHKLKRRLYDTFYDIGFKAYKTICLTIFDEESERFQMKAFLMNKSLTLKDAQNLILSTKSAFGLIKSKSISSAKKI